MANRINLDNSIEGIMSQQKIQSHIFYDIYTNLCDVF